MGGNWLRHVPFLSRFSFLTLMMEPWTGSRAFRFPAVFLSLLVDTGKKGRRV